jgi:hypothetical protein
MSELRALSVRQPYAWSIVSGGKEVENRSRRTTYRGTVAIHASLAWDKGGEKSPLVQHGWARFVKNLPQMNRPRFPLDKSSLWMEFGAVIGVVDIVGCHEHGDPDVPCGANGAGRCSDWAVRSPWHWELGNARPLPKPIPARGALGLWRMPDEVEQQVRDFLATLTPAEATS